MPTMPLPLVEPWPFRGPLMRDRAIGRLADEARIFRERARAMPRRRRFPRLMPPRKLGFIDQEIHAARRGIDPDAVAVAHQRQRTANERFRRDVADTHPPCCAGETPICDQGDLLS